MPKELSECAAQVKFLYPNLKLITLIITNNTEYLNKSIESSICPFIIYDNIEPFTKNTFYEKCNFNNPSKAKNFGLKKVKDVEFVQFLDSDDFLHENYFEELNKCISINSEYDLFYTDYNILNEDFGYTYKEYLVSPSSFNMKTIAHKIKNPIIKLSALKNKKFDENLSCFEMVDMMYQFGYKNMHHIPHALQTTRVHSKCRERITSTLEKQKALDIINGRLHGKI